MAENSVFLRATSHNASRPRRSRDRLGDLGKRAFDILVSLLGMILLSPFFLFIAFLVKRDSPGPAIYRGPRLGRKGKIFFIQKFRTMHEAPESYQGPRITSQDDPRITRLGHWLRNTKLNELPQLWNVLKGEMSLVGPRPEDPQITSTLPVEALAEVQSVRPGMTSPASVLYRNEETLLRNDRVMDTYLESIVPSKLRLDQLYVRNRSMWLDLDTLFWTFLVLLPRLGSYAPPEELIFSGPVSQFIRRHASWFTLDTLVTLVVVGLTGMIWRLAGPLNVGPAKAVVFALGFALLFSITNAMLGVNRISWLRANASEALALAPAAVLATVVALVANQFVTSGYFGVTQAFWGAGPMVPAGMILMASVLAFIGFVTVRYRGRLISGFAEGWLKARGDALAAQERVLIIGSGETGQFAAWLLSKDNSRRVFRIVGFVDDDIYKRGMRIHGLDVLGRREDIPCLVTEHDIGLLVFAIHKITPEERSHLLEICASTRARVIMMPDVFGALATMVSQDSDLAGIENTQDSEAGVTRSPEKAHLISPSQVDTWLAGLEQTMQSGDKVSTQEYIQEIRSQLKTGTTTREMPVYNG